MKEFVCNYMGFEIYKYSTGKHEAYQYGDFMFDSTSLEGIFSRIEEYRSR